jgi:Domain of unknown function (DUF4304)
MNKEIGEIWKADLSDESISLVMEIKLFKKILNITLLGKGFRKKGSYYWRDGEDCVCIVGIQRSNYSSGYYVNVGFILRGLNSITDGLKDTDGDVRARFTHNIAGQKVSFFDLEILQDSDEQHVRESIIENVNDIIEPALKADGIKALLSERPVLLYQTKLSAKQFLGINN